MPLGDQYVKEIISMNFSFLQIYDDNEGGRKVCIYYHFSSSLVIVSITRKIAKSWTTLIDPKILLRDLIPYMENIPKEFGYPRIRANQMPFHMNKYIVKL